VEGLGTNPVDLGAVDPRDRAGSSGRGGALGWIYSMQAGSVAAAPALVRGGRAEGEAVASDRASSEICLQGMLQTSRAMNLKGGGGALDYAWGSDDVHREGGDNRGREP
jgi:hypothetical protein